MGGTAKPYRRNSSTDSVHGGRGICQAVASLFDSTSVQNADTLIRLVRSRPPGIPLITVSNHMSTLDDPVMWGFKGFPSMDAKLARWVLAAKDIFFKNALLSYFFQLGMESDAD
ncbi:hypothetical protein AAG906_031870 [Vitis piasezkii]